MTTPERPPLPEVNELALRLAARVLRRDVDGGAPAARELWQCARENCLCTYVADRAPVVCGSCGYQGFKNLGPPDWYPPGEAPEDELKGLARDIETFADLVVARLGSVRWELDRAEKQLRVQDGEIETLQYKLDEERKTGKVLALQVKGVQRRVAAEMRERAARAVDEQARNEKSIPAFQTLEEAAARIRALPLPGAADEDATEPETPAARAVVREAFICAEETCDWRGLLRLSSAPCGSCGKAVQLFPGVVKVEPTPDARARQASAGARAVAKLEALSAEDIVCLKDAGWRMENDKWVNPKGVVTDPRTPFGLAVLRRAVIELRGAPPPAPENLAEAGAPDVRAILPQSAGGAAAIRRAVNALRRASCNATADRLERGDITPSEALQAFNGWFLSERLSADDASCRAELEKAAEIEGKVAHVLASGQGCLEPTCQNPAHAPPENLAPAPAARYVCENDGCGYKGSRDVPQRPGLCPRCKCELTARPLDEELPEAPAVRLVDDWRNRAKELRKSSYSDIDKGIALGLEEAAGELEGAWKAAAPENLHDVPPPLYACRNESCSARNVLSSCKLPCSSCGSQRKPFLLL